MNENLKPCPFCHQIPEWMDAEKTYTRCLNQDCAIYFYPVGVAHWNTRSDGKMVEEMRNLKAQLMKLSVHFRNYYAGAIHRHEWESICDETQELLTKEQPPIGNETGVYLITEERQRQIAQEGWTPAHDDEHGMRELAYAAITYTLETTAQKTLHYWPWRHEWWKPTDDPVRNLVKAGALIAAEIDRLQRKSKPTNEQR